MCNSSLKSDIGKNPGHVVITEDSGKKSDVCVSLIVGDQSTYKADLNTVQVSGHDAGRHTYLKKGEKFERCL